MAIKFYPVFLLQKSVGRIVALDFGKVRTGIAVTDELRLIASGLQTVPTPVLLDFLRDYVRSESVDIFVIGEPRQMNYQPSESEALIIPFIKRLQTIFPQIPIERQDERFTSRMAARSLAESGAKKRKREDKSLLDQISATLILQAYLDRIR